MFTHFSFGKKENSHINTGQMVQLETIGSSIQKDKGIDKWHENLFKFVITK